MELEYPNHTGARWERRREPTSHPGHTRRSVTHSHSLQNHLPGNDGKMDQLSEPSQLNGPKSLECIPLDVLDLS